MRADPGRIIHSGQRMSRMMMPRHSALLRCVAVCLLAACSHESKQADAEDVKTLSSSPKGTSDAQVLAASGSTHPWCGSGRQQNVTSFLITSDSLGPVSSGISRARLQALCPGLKDTLLSAGEGDFTRGTVLRFLGMDVGVIEWSDTQKLERLLISSGSVATVTGLRVGSTMRDIRSHIRRLTAGYDEFGVYVWAADVPTRLSFLLRWETDGVLKSPDDVGQPVDLIPDSVHVRTMIMDARN